MKTARVLSSVHCKGKGRKRYRDDESSKMATMCKRAQNDGYRGSWRDHSHVHREETPTRKATVTTWSEKENQEQWRIKEMENSAPRGPVVGIVSENWKEGLLDDEINVSMVEEPVNKDLEKLEKNLVKMEDEDNAHSDSTVTDEWVKRLLTNEAIVAELLAMAESENWEETITKSEENVAMESVGKESEKVEVISGADGDPLGMVWEENPVILEEWPWNCNCEREISCGKSYDPCWEFMDGGEYNAADDEDVLWDYYIWNQLVETSKKNNM